MKKVKGLPANKCTSTINKHSFATHTYTRVVLKGSAWLEGVSRNPTKTLNISMPVMAENALRFAISKYLSLFPLPSFLFVLLVKKIQSYGTSQLMVTLFIILLIIRKFRHILYHVICCSFIFPLRLALPHLTYILNRKYYILPFLTIQLGWEACNQLEC